MFEGLTSVFEIAAMAIAYVAMFGIKHTTRAAVSNGDRMVWRGFSGLHMIGEIRGILGHKSASRRSPLISHSPFLDGFPLADDKATTTLPKVVSEAFHAKQTGSIISVLTQISSAPLP